MAQKCYFASEPARLHTLQYGFSLKYPRACGNMRAFDCQSAVDYMRPFDTLPTGKYLARQTPHNQQTGLTPKRRQTQGPLFWRSNDDRLHGFSATFGSLEKNNTGSDSGNTPTSQFLSFKKANRLE